MVSPILFIVVLYLFQISIESTSTGDFFDIVHHENEQPILDIPFCVVGPNSDQCWTIAYAPDTPEVQEVIRLVCVITPVCLNVV